MDSSMYKAAREGNFTGLENSIRQIHGGNREEETLLDHLLLETRKGNNLVHLAVESGHKGFIQQVLRKCPQLAVEPNSCGETPLHVAARTGRFHIVEAILSKAKPHGGTPTTDMPGTRQMKKMEDGGAAGIKSSLLRLTNKGGNTALHKALRSGDKKMGMLLWKEDREMVGSANEARESALFVAAELGIEKVVVEMVEFLDMQREAGVWHGALSGPDGQNPLHAAVLAEAGVVMVSWRQLRLPHRWNLQVGFLPSTDEQKAGVLDSEQTYRQNCQTLLMIATLITTVTFAATFTMPGGYNNNVGPGQGVALLRSSRYLKWFIISDTIAMTCSIMAASLILWGAAFVKRPYVHCYVIAAVLTCIALQSTAISFLTGLQAVLPDERYVHTMGYIVGCAFYANSCLFLFRLAETFSYFQVCLSLISCLRRLKCIINSHVANK